MERFITNKDNNMIVYNPNLPAFVYYFNDEHIYLIMINKLDTRLT